MAEPLEFLARIEGDARWLYSPGVGLFSGALAAGTVLTPGQVAGELATLGKRARLLVPPEVSGVVRSKPPLLLRAPVGYGDVLYELAPLGGGEHVLAAAAAVPGELGGELVLRATQAGRFYHRGAPGEPSMCEVGRELEPGTPIGLIEVMKTFTQVVYRPDRGLPARARIVRVLARDGGDVDEGAALIAVEPR